MQQILYYLQTADVYSPGIITILVLVGFGVGFINTIAGLATAITYALFMAMGMPINKLAKATPSNSAGKKLVTKCTPSHRLRHAE